MAETTRPEIPEGRAARIAYLATLEAGWFDDGEGAAISPTVVDVAHQVAERLPEASIFPTPEGGIQFEWGHKDQFYWEIGIAPDGQGLHVFGIPTDLSDKRSWSQDFSDLDSVFEFISRTAANELRSTEPAHGE